MTELVITAYGHPATQGSKTRTPHGMRDDNAKTLHPWRKAVTAAAEATPPSEPIEGPVEVEVTITLRRPGHHYRTGRYAHLLRDDAPGWPIARGSGDSDKYLRAVCDALTDAHVWHDDVQAVESHVRKVYVNGGIDALEQPGAVIRIRPLLAAVNAA